MPHRSQVCDATVFAGTTVPPMPGHDDWVADPVQEGAQAQSRAQAAPAAALEHY